MSSAKAPVPERRPWVLNINILPEEFRQRRLSNRLLLLFSLVLVAALLLSAIYPRWSEARASLAHTEALFQARQQELKAFQAQETEIKKLTEAIENAEKKARDARADYQLFQKTKVKWSPLLLVVTQAAPQGITLVGLSQKESQIDVQGKAPEQALIMAYANALRQPGLFSDISVVYEPARPPAPSPGKPLAGEKSPQGFDFTITLKARPGGQP